jgi:quercetin dioxygenase-like cupin family protein
MALSPSGRTVPLMFFAALAVGAMVGIGLELAYVLEGSVVVECEGQPSVTFKTGDALKNVGAHDARNPGSASARLLAVYLVEKGKPLAEPVK